ncbi:MAG: hypothetical protein HKM04_00070 [Legionellales bacterium]|nr:hypothetical protein [Legionellales bacterium]
MSRKCSFTKYSGIGLLELMLSLAIIAILLIMAVRYFQSASNNNAMNSAVDDCNAIKAAAKAYIGANPQGAATVDLPDLVAGGYLPSSFGSTAATAATASPWGTEITISIIPPTVSCTITGIPQALCNGATSPMAQKASQTLSQGESATCATAGTLLITYQL